MYATNKYEAEGDGAAEEEEMDLEDQKMEALSRGVVLGDPSRLRLPPSASCLINPRGTFQSRWDVVMLVALIYTAIVTPFEVAFIPPSFGALFIINRIVDYLFLQDLVQNFFLPYYSNKESGYVISKSGIACNYLRFWFWIDFVSILPFDSVSLATNSDELKNLMVFRVIRLARLAKLLRIFRSSRLFRRWESRIGLQHSTQTMMKWLMTILTLCHWLAAAWYLTTTVELSTDKGAMDNWRSKYDDGVTGIWDSYITSLYWSVMTCTTIGYGDVTPETDAERVVSIIAMCLGSAMYAYIVGNICGVIATMDQASTEFHATMDDLNLYMNENNLPRDLRIRLREYFMYCRHQQRQKYYQGLLTKMSPALRGEVTVFINRAWIDQVPFFCRKASSSLSIQITHAEHNQFITEISMKLNALAFAPQELIIKLGEPASAMYIVQKGVVAKQGQVLSQGRFFGEDIIMKAGRRPYLVRALTFVDCFSLRKKDLERILESADYSGMRKKIRRAALCESFKSNFIRLAGMRHGASQAIHDADARADARPPKSPESKEAQQGVMIVAQQELEAAREAQSPTAGMFESPTAGHGSTTTPSRSSGRRRERGSSSRRRGSGDGGGGYAKSKPPRILEMLQNRHDELVSAIQNVSQRADRRADLMDQRLQKMSSQWMMGLVVGVILLGGICVGLLLQ